MAHPRGSESRKGSQQLRPPLTIAIQELPVAIGQVRDQGSRPATCLGIADFIAANATRRGTSSARILRFADLTQRTPPPTTAIESTKGLYDEGQPRRCYDVNRERQRQADEADDPSDGRAEHRIDRESADAGRSRQCDSQSCQPPGTNQGLDREGVDSVARLTCPARRPPKRSRALAVCSATRSRSSGDAFESQSSRFVNS